MVWEQLGRGGKYRLCFHLICVGMILVLYDDRSVVLLGVPYLFCLTAFLTRLWEDVHSLIPKEKLLRASSMIIADYCILLRIIEEQAINSYIIKDHQ
jgi:hypothetical protein